ncbi:MAG: CopG family transcriptional regulator [Bdellovibrionota bacterium]
MKRTTLKIDEDLYPKLKMKAQKAGVSMKEVINQLIRIGLSNERVSLEKKGVFTVQAFDLGLRPGIDSTKFNQLYDEIESQDYVMEEPDDCS